MKEGNDIRELAFMYFSGTISREDETVLFNNVNSSIEAQRLFRVWEQEWISRAVSSPETDEAWQRVRSKMHTLEAIHGTTMKLSGRKLWRRVAAVAAVLLLTMVGTWGVTEYISSIRPDTYFSCSAPYGEKSKVLLSDGTVVWLNAGSTLKYSNRFGLSNREVMLDGEGYFEVTKGRKQEFVVHTCGYEIVVKGTRFNVSAYPEDTFVATTLLEGLVEVHYKEEKMMLYPGEMLSLDKRDDTFTHSRVNASQSMAWSEDRIEYEDITLRELAVRLSRQYNVTVQLQLPSDSLMEKTFRVSLRNRETIGEVLSALQQVLPIQVERKGKQIIIR